MNTDSQIKNLQPAPLSLTNILHLFFQSTPLRNGEKIFAYRRSEGQNDKKKKILWKWKKTRNEL